VRRADRFFAPSFLAYFRTPDRKISEKLDLLRPLRIRCPVCAWQPAAHDTWSCNPQGCGNLWNTFATHGVCPACSREWAETACLRCAAWSPHDDWYVEDE
jgi:hypothetical protein